MDSLIERMLFQKMEWKMEWGIFSGRDDQMRTSGLCFPWEISSSSDPRALAVVDGLGEFSSFGPHYSRRTPGARTFTGVGKEIVLISRCGRAVWAVVFQKTPARAGTGVSRGRSGMTDGAVRFVWRNMLFRNLGAGLSSELIDAAVLSTYEIWKLKYGSLPAERLRTEIEIASVRSTNPGFCYLRAGWEKGETVRGKVYLYAPGPSAYAVDPE